MKKTISILTIITILVMNIYVLPVNADIVTNIQRAKEARDQVIDFMTSSPSSVTPEVVDDLLKRLSLPAGLIVGGHVFAANQFNDLLRNILGNNNTSEEDAQEVARLVIDNITISDNQININPIGKQILNDYSNYVEDLCSYKYVYAHSIQNDSIGNAKDWLQTKLLTYQNNSICTLGAWSTSVGLDVIPINDVVWIEQNSNSNFSYCAPYDSNLESLAGQTVEHYYFWSSRSSSDTYQSKTENTTFNSTYTFVTDPSVQTAFDNSGQISSWDQIGYYVFSFVVPFFGSDNLGIPQYYTSSNWQNFENSGNNTTYTIDSSNSNNMTFGDITNYINSYNTENGQNPSPSDIQIYIDVTYPEQNPTPTPTPTSTPDNPGGGGNGSGEGTMGIFDFLSRLGEVLGNLIKNLGEMLTNLIEGIVETITSVVGAIPNIFQPLISYVFGGLPESIQAMIILGITCMIVVGIIKAFKG